MPGSLRPLVGVSQRIVEVPAYGEYRDCLDQAWSQWLYSLGYIGVALPNIGVEVEDLVRQLNLSAIVMSGGNNFCSNVYASPSPDIKDAFSLRDETESSLVEYALNSGTPLIGWCRGMQVLQVHFGGRLHATDYSSVQHVAAEHEVQLIEDRFINLSATKRVVVNSYHDFGVKVAELAQPLAPFAVSADGFAEGIYLPGHAVIGAQWHPERENRCSSFNRELFEYALHNKFEPK